LHSYPILLLGVYGELHTNSALDPANVVAVVK